MTDEVEVDEHQHDDLNEQLHVSQFLELKPHHPRYLCPYGCNKLIASRTIDYHKNNGCGRRLTDSIASHPELKKRFYCCGACYAEFVTRVEFHAHLRVEHDIHPEIHNMQFPDRVSFDRFLHWLEAEGGAHFRHKSGAKRRGRGKGIFLACNRSGYVSNEKTIQPGDRTGPFRLGFTCTAYIHATEHQDGHVSAELCGDHYGHDARMRLPNAIKYIIAQKQMEGVPTLDIMGFLRHRFHQFTRDNIYAQRICFVDSEELKSIHVSNTKRWAKEGIPKSVEVWEEELLEMGGLTWPPRPRNAPPVFQPTRKGLTTAEIAIQENWPRPRVFNAKIRREDGSMVPFDMATGEVVGAEYVQDEDIDEQRYMMEMNGYADEFPEHHQRIVVEEGEEVVMAPDRYERRIVSGSTNLIGEEVEVETEEIVVSSDNADETIQKIQEEIVEEHVIGSPTNEIVIVDGDNEEEEEVEDIEMHHHRQSQQMPHRLHRDRHDDDDQAGPSDMLDPHQRFIETSKVEVIDLLMDELAAYKQTILKRAESMSLGNLNALLVRTQSLHRSAMEKEHSAGVPLTVFPNRSKFMYRPGKGLEKMDQEYRGGDVTLQPIEDEISDDEEIVRPCSDAIVYSNNIWG